jgi:hypothetical protein
MMWAIQFYECECFQIFVSNHSSHVLEEWGDPYGFGRGVVADGARANE